MQEQESLVSTNYDLSRRIDWLESRLRQMQRSQRKQRITAAGFSFAMLACLTLWAQNAARPLTVRAPFRVLGANGMTLLSITESGPGAGLLEMKSTNGKSFTAGMTPEGVPFSRWDATNGAAFIGLSPGKTDFGIRLLAAGTNTPTVAMVEKSDSAMVAVGRNGTARLSMLVNATDAVMGVLDNAGQSYLSALKDHGGSGGDIEIANGSGQVVAFMDANPKTNEGRATFTDAGGRPLAKIGAAGEHGDVLLGGPNKGVAVWEMALTGMIH